MNNIQLIKIQNCRGQVCKSDFEKCQIESGEFARGLVDWFPIAILRLGLLCNWVIEILC